MKAKLLAQRTVSSRVKRVASAASVGTKFLVISLLCCGLRTFAESALITVDAARRIGPISPLVYGQFIEHLGHCVNGGVFEPGSSLSDTNGFRRDVLEKARELSPPLLRWPGGTFSKIYHWQDGIGPKNERRRRPNLIWGGEEDNQFGTDEFIQYCRRLGAEPYITVNMATGSAEEAANWVEYCNGTGNTYYAALRCKNGFAEPHRVKFWGLGNEEDAEPDCGRLQDPTHYAAEAWQFAKLMKLQDPGIKLIIAGCGNGTWNRTVLKSLHPVADFFSLHWYCRSKDPETLFGGVAGFDRRLEEMGKLLAEFPVRVTEFPQWYRFPPRDGPVKLAVDEWGIWNGGQSGKEEMWGLDMTYSWQDALGVASWLNALQRHADITGMATWAQLVNIIAPILSDAKASIRQVVFYPLELYRRHSGNWAVSAQCQGPALPGGSKLPALDVSASLDERTHTLTLAVVNRHPTEPIAARIQFQGTAYRRLQAGYELTAPALDAHNSLASPTSECVCRRRFAGQSDFEAYSFPPCSISLLLLQ